MHSLEGVYADIQVDPFWDYLRLPGIKFVPGRGQRDTPVAMIVGEAPGATENARQEPFCGPSGTVLKHLMDAAHLRAEALSNQYVYTPDGHEGMTHEEESELWDANVWITNVVKYRPPHNETPNLAAIWHAKDDLRREYRALGSPPVIIAVGGVAHAAIHPEASVMSVSRARHAFFKPRHPETGERLEKGPWIISAFHPAYGLRKGKKVQEIMTQDWTDIGEMLVDMGIM
jgi:uracil-DNA glycosylase family 4